MGSHPGERQSEIEVNQAVKRVREKVLDDIRRNRELATGGLSVLPVLKEDLYEPGGLDMLAMQLVELVEKSTGRDMSVQRLVLESGALSTPRYRTMLSLLPGKNQRATQVLKRAGSLNVYESEPGVSECWIEL